MLEITLAGVGGMGGQGTGGGGGGVCFTFGNIINNLTPSLLTGENREPQQFPCLIQI